jgi:hypothetical protein
MIIERIMTCLGCFGGVLVSAASLAAAGPAAGTAVNPFADNNGQIPAAAEYRGPLFALNHHYPIQVAPPAMPWRAAIGNAPINVDNASLYAEALKAAVAKDMQTLLFNYDSWDAAQRGWYNEPWLGAQREAIHGMHVATASFDPSLFRASGLTRPMTTYVLTYFDKTAAQTLGRIWGASALRPRITPGATQYAEGSIIVKAAFVTTGPDYWPPMTGTQVWPAYITTNATTGQNDKPTVTNTYLMQLDIIVKDSKSAPKTGWVFTTLVYDRNVAPAANGIWDQMVPLGAQWGNDPQANSAVNPAAPLLENWINPKAPLYATETLGWGERLSGPNDGAMNDISIVENGARVYLKNAKDSSCMSCHSSAQWKPSDPLTGMQSFLLPLLPPTPSATVAPLGGQPYLNSPVPGSPDWMKWFQNRPGTLPMDGGSVAADFDLTLTFKALPAWFKATTGQDHSLSATDRAGKALQRDYNGKQER